MPLRTATTVSCGTGRHFGLAPTRMSVREAKKERVNVSLPRAHHSNYTTHRIDSSLSGRSTFSTGKSRAQLGCLGLLARLASLVWRARGITHRRRGPWTKHLPAQARELRTFIHFYSTMRGIVCLQLFLLCGPQLLLVCVFSSAPFVGSYCFCYFSKVATTTALWNRLKT